MTGLHQRVQPPDPAVLRGLRRGLEKEGLRVMADGTLSSRPHPPGLGAALTHPLITTDFSEAQLELVTGVHVSIDDCLRELAELHQVVYREIGDELIWCASLPCKLPDDDRIPIAQYGTSNVGRMKTLYRQGLAHRYGRRMQVISGIHYNFSLPDEAWPVLREADGSTVPEDVYRDQRYLALIRNFRRHSWLLVLLLGSSPAACASFVAGRKHGLTALGAATVYGPGATSLRMGRLGYQSDAQSSLDVSFNDLAGYAAALGRALTRPYAEYEAIGLRDGDGYRQLSTTLLQVENEFYGTIRPKRTTRPGERTLRALGERGIEYVEVRCLDVDPFLPLGIDADALRLLDMFLVHCLVAESPLDTPAEAETMRRNLRRVAEHGRDPLVRLDRHGEALTPGDWGQRLLAQLEPIAEALDRAHGGGDHARVLAGAQHALRDLSLLPSARVLREIESAHGKSFASFALHRSTLHRRDLSSRPLAPRTAARYAELAARSLAEQRRIEAEDRLDFEAYRLAYLGQELSGPHFRGQ